MNDNVINSHDLDRIVKLLMHNKAIVAHWKKGTGLKFTYSGVISKNKLPLEQKKLFKKGYLRDFISLRPKQTKAFELALENYTGVLPVTFSALKRGDGTRTNKNICIYTTNINENNPYWVTTGLYYLDKQGSRATSYVATNRNYFKGYDNITVKLSKTHTHELGHHFGLRDTDNSILEGQRFDSKYFTMMSYTNIPGGEPEGLMLYDVLALQAYYGFNHYKNTESNRYIFDDKSKPLCIWDTGGIDEIVINDQLNFDKTVDLRQGGRTDSRIAIAYKVTIENLTFNQLYDNIFLNEVDNVVTINNDRRSAAFHITDTHVDIDIHPESNDKKITQKLSRSKTENGKDYVGWGNDIIQYNQHDLPNNKDEPHKIIFDVEDKATFEFHHCEYSDLVVTHKSKALDGSGKIYTSSLKIKNFSKLQKNIIFLIRTKTFEEWLLVQKKYKEHIDYNIEQAKAGRYFAKDGSEGFEGDPYNPKINGSFAKNVQWYDNKNAFVARQQSSNSKLVEYYKQNQQTQAYVPLMIQWSKVKNEIKKEDITTKQSEKGTVKNHFMGSYCALPAEKSFYIGELLEKGNFTDVDDGQEYDVLIENHRDRKKSNLQKLEMTGEQIKLYKLDGMKNGQYLNISILKEGEIIKNYLVFSSATAKKVDVKEGVASVHMVTGSSIPVKELYRNVKEIVDISKEDNLSIRHNKRSIGYAKWHQKISLNTTLHWSGQGSSLIRTKNGYNESKFNIVLFGFGG